MAENLAGCESHDREMIRRFADPLMERAGFLVLKGNLFDFAILKTSVISDAFRARYLSRPGQEGMFEARAIVFDGSDDYHHRINDPSLAIDDRSEEHTSELQSLMRLSSAVFCLKKQHQ